MNIQEMIGALKKQANEEQEKIHAQEAVVNEIAQQYKEQLAVLKAMRITVQAVNNSISELSAAIKIPCKEENDDLPAETENNADENYKELTYILEQAADEAAARGLFLEFATTKTGIKLDIRSSLINRARNAIIRSCNGSLSYKDYVATMTEDDILKLRNVGRKTQYIIWFAKDIIENEKNKEDESNG